MSSVSSKMKTIWFLQLFSPNSSIQEFDKVILGDDFQPHPGNVFDLSDTWAILLMTTLFGCVALHLAGKGYIIWFVKCRAQERPLNTMIMIDQVI